MANPVWRLYIAEQAADWLRWLKNIHLNSYQELTQRFILMNPNYMPGDSQSFEEGDVSNLFNKLMVNREFILRLSDTGIIVWVNSSIKDFLDELRPYSIVNREFRTLYNLINNNSAWFHRQFQFLKEDLLLYVKENGRQL